MAGSASRFSLEIDHGQGVTTVSLSGLIDGNVAEQFEALRARLRGSVVFDFAGVGRINSAGVLEWTKLIADLVVDVLTYARCPPAIVMQLNTITGFRGRAKIASFFAPYICEHCGTEKDKLLGGDVRAVPDVKCEACGLPMEFDDFAESYLSFLNDG